MADDQLIQDISKASGEIRDLDNRMKAHDKESRAIAKEQSRLKTDLLTLWQRVVNGPAKPEEKPKDPAEGDIPF